MSLNLSSGQHVNVDGIGNGPALGVQGFVHDSTSFYLSERNDREVSIDLQVKQQTLEQRLGFDLRMDHAVARLFGPNREFIREISLKQDIGSKGHFRQELRGAEAKRLAGVEFALRSQEGGYVELQNYGALYGFESRDY